jgi:phosphate:Na+ symporter
MFGPSRSSRASVFPLSVFCLGALLLGGASVAWAGDNEQGIDWTLMGMGLFGGLALFLYGMDMMSDALKALSGERMKDILAKLTANRWMGAVTGAFVTAVIQSSSVTTVLVVGFITAGLMSLAQSISVIMGANIGTMITAQIIAFKISKSALLMISIGFSMLFASKQEQIRQYGATLMGLGMIFFGMSVMSEAMTPLRSYQPFLELMATMENPLVAILVAAVFTGLVQSSSAATGIVILMAGQGFISFRDLLYGFHRIVAKSVVVAIEAVSQKDEAVAQTATSMKQEISRIADSAAIHEAQRLVA